MLNQTLSQVDCDSLSAWLKPQLAHCKLPREIVVREAIPHLVSGKFDRVTLAKWGMQQFGGWRVPNRLPPARPPDRGRTAVP